MNVFIFAGTTEGRELAEILSKNEIFCTVSVATEYGASLLPCGKNLTVLQGRMTAEQMAEKISQNEYRFIIDATHPFAIEVSKEIKKACETTKNEYLRLSRNTKNCDKISSSQNLPDDSDGFFYFDTISQAADWLESQSGKIFVTTGSKELPVLADKISDKKRLFVRVLPSTESLEICAKCGIMPKQIIAMQGPFSNKTNEVQFEESGAEILLTKESGVLGGFFEKIEAADKLGMKIAVIKNPENHADGEKSYSLDEILRKIADSENGKSIKKTGFFTKTARKISLIGIGMGSENLLTVESRSALQKADIIFGAERILKSVEGAKNPEIPAENLYEAKKIAEFLENHPDFKRPVVVFSGDVGFYSGASKFFEEKNLFSDWEIQVLPGISSVQYFSSKLGKSWQGWKFLSLHGSKCNLIEEIRRNPACFFILSGEKDIVPLAEKLEKAVQNGILKDIVCHLGSNFSYPDEKIAEISLDELKNLSSNDAFCQPDSLFLADSCPKIDSPKNSLFVLLIENKAACSETLLPVLDDEDFIRAEKIPMTKKEVRQLSVCALELSSNSVVYDIGSGTGSISVESARIAVEGRVFAVDCKEEAVLLTKQNVEKFCLENVECVHSDAVDFLKNEEIPAPTHAFIGGSGGNLAEIVCLLIQKNPSVRIVSNFVSLENLCEMQAVLKSLEKDSGSKENANFSVEIRQVAVSRAEKAGSFNLMKAQNPVWIVSFARKSFGLEKSGGKKQADGEQK